MNTCLFFILLISVTSIIMIDAGCGPRPDISNAVFTDDENCNDIKITCKNGYRMHQLLSCVDGQWVYQEPNCAPVPAPVKCLSGEKIANSENLTQSRVVGEDFEFSCQSEFTKNGTTGVLTCGENGNWTIKEPCKVCNMPGIAINIGPKRPIAGKYNSTTCKDICDQDDECGYSLFSTFSNKCTIFPKPISFFADVLSISICIEKCKELTECLIVSFSNDGCVIFNATLEILKDQFRIGDGNFIRDKGCLE